MSPSESDSEQLLDLAGDGDAAAIAALLDRHRDQLERMVSVRMDARLRARLDASDVVQDALIEAAHRLPAYAKDRPIAFYPWLRRLAWERLVQLHRYHHDRQKRSVKREERNPMPLPDESAMQLVDQLVGTGTSPSGRCTRREIINQVHAALASLPEIYREILVLRHLEQLSVTETAAVLDTSPGTVKSRHYRAISQLQRLLTTDLSDMSPTWGPRK